MHHPRDHLERVRARAGKFIVRNDVHLSRHRRPARVPPIGLVGDTVARRRAFDAARPSARRGGSDPVRRRLRLVRGEPPRGRGVMRRMRRGFRGARIALERRDEDVLLAQAHAVLEHQAHLLALGRQFVIRRQHSSVLVLGRRRLRPSAATRKLRRSFPGERECERERDCDVAA